MKGVAHGSATLRARDDARMATAGYPLPAELDVVLDQDGTAAIFDPTNDEATITCDRGILWLGDYR